MTKTPTIYDVAQRAGVSKSLVSLVLRDSPRVSEEKRAAVLEAVAALDYTPSRLAAGLAGTRTRSVGVIIDDFENLWFASSLTGLRESLTEGGYSLSVADAALNSHLNLDPIDVFRSLRVDGLVLAGEVSLRAVERLRVPSVVLGTREVKPTGVPVVASDEVEGGRLAARHLLELGHTRVLCVSAPGASAADRERGFVDVLRASGHDSAVLRSERTTEEAAYAAVDHFLDGHEAPTAVFAVNDPMAAGVIGALRNHGLVVPTDVSVVGYDDSPLAAYEFLSLTSVNGEGQELGAETGRRLMQLLELPRPSGEQSGSQHAEHDTVTLVPPRLVRRRSSSAPS